MKKKACTLVLLVLFFISYQKVNSQINPDSVEVITKELSPGLYEISLYGGNLLLSVGNDGLFLVDASYKELAEKLRTEIRKIDPRPVKYLVNTHWHFDHVGGNQLFGKDATIIAHEYTCNLLNHDQELMGSKYPALPKDACPDISFTKNLTFYINSDTVQLIALPGGHTGGDIMVYFKKAKVLHVGDMVFADMFPFCDVDHGGKVSKMDDAVQEITSMFSRDITIIPGHGKTYSIMDMARYREMLMCTFNTVKSQMDKGKSLEDIKKADVLKFWRPWAIAFSCDEWIEMIYKSSK